MLDILSQFPSLPAQGVTCTDHGELLDLHVDLARAGLGQGMLAHQFDGDTLLSLADARFDHPHRLRVEVPDDVLFVRASLGASTDYRVGDAATWRFRRPEVTVSAVPRCATIDIDVHAQVSVLSMSLMFRPRTLVERHRIALRELPAPMRDLVEGSLAAPVLMATLPIGADVAALVRDLAHSRLTGSLRRTQLQARSAELLVLVAAVWRERLGHESWPGARPRDAELLAAARRVLAERFAQPPTLVELSALLGTNKNKINQLFRAQLQVTPQAYCMRLRVERAQALIAQGCMNLAEVAEAVGYQHQSSFTEAFRQVTGMPPGRYAQMARQASQAGRALQ